MLLKEGCNRIDPTGTPYNTPGSGPAPSGTPITIHSPYPRGYPCLIRVSTMQSFRRGARGPVCTKSLRSDAIAPVLNKVEQIAASPHLRLILGQVAPRFDLAFTMQNRRILIANLANGTIGEQAENLLGSLLVSHLQLIAMERGALPPQDRAPFFVHVDEFQTFSSDAFASLLSEARKFGMHFVLANQYSDQLSNAVRAAVIGNAGTLIVFRVGSRDAELLAPEFRPMDAETPRHTYPDRLRVKGDRICNIRHTDNYEPLWSLPLAASASAFIRSAWRRTTTSRRHRRSRQASSRLFRNASLCERPLITS